MRSTRVESIWSSGVNAKMTETQPVSKAYGFNAILCEHLISSCAFIPTTGGPTASLRGGVAREQT